MLTLTFNTTTKEVKILQDKTILYVYQNVPTVKPHEGYYEILQEEADRLVGTKRYPVARVPISNTLMLIEK